jgi:dienelactone hydrolase
VVLLTCSSGFANAACTLVPWFWYHRQSVTIAIVKSFFQTLRSENSERKIGVAGFCWGGRYAILLGEDSFSEDEKLVDAVFAGHPSFVSIPADVESRSCPTSIAVAGTDTVFSPKMAADVEKLWRSDDQPTEIVVYEGAKHGFCIGGNMSDEKEKDDMAKGVSQVLSWKMELTVGCQLVQQTFEMKGTRKYLLNFYIVLYILFISLGS